MSTTEYHWVPMSTTEPLVMNPLLVLADMADLLRRLPTLPDPDAEVAIGRAIARADLLVSGQVPHLVAIVTDRAQRADYTARCTECRWLESAPLSIIAARARTHAVTTGHVVHVVAKPSAEETA